MRTKPAVRGNGKETHLGYQDLEPRRLLAVDFSSNQDYTESSDLISVLSEPVPMQQRFEVLQDHLDLTKHEAFRLVQLDRDELGFAHLKHQQYFNGIKVQGGEYTVHIKDRQVVSISGNYVSMDGQSRRTSIGENSALESALDYVNANKYIWEDPTLSHQLSLQQLPEGDLVYVRPSSQGSAVLTYKFDIYAVEPLSRDYLFVDANSGEVVQTYERFHAADVAATGNAIYEGNVSFTADSFAGGFRLRQSGDGVETYDLNNTTSYGSATDFVSSTTTFDATDVGTGVQAHFGAEKTLQYFSEKFGRDSYDDQGSTLLSYVSYGTDYVNAFWDGSRMTYGDGDGVDFGPLVSLDIVGHEIAHGVTEFSAGLIYQDESGALNESFSDIFGESIENFATGSNDWLMGDDIGINGSGAFRSMSDPNSKGDPDTYLGDFWFSGSGDNGGVHSNSGVQNKWFYILTVGESGINDNGDVYDVTGLGYDDAASIAYRNLTVYLTQSSNYFDAREGAIQSAVDLFGAGSTQHLATEQAWDAVGVYGTNLNINPSLVIAEGAGIYYGSDSDSIPFAGVVDSTSFEFDANQNLTLMVQGSSGLVPTLELRDPNDNVVGNASTSGSLVMIESLHLLESGTYTIRIGGDGGTTGDYRLEILLNANSEAESLGLGSNNTLATAENLDPTSWSLGDGNVDRIGTLGFVGSLVGESDDFESGTLDSAWTTSSTHPDGRILVTGGAGTAAGDFALFMDQENDNNYNLNEAIWTVDLTSLSTPILSFFHAEWSDETDVLPATFVGSENGDGVAISDDGVNWYTVLTDTDTPATVYQRIEIDLAAEAALAGIALGENFRVKFQQYDNYSFSDDGRAYDEISITDQVSDADWFSFNVEAGQSLALAATSIASFGSLQLDLYDESGALLVSGVSAENVSSQLSFVNDGPQATWYAKVEGNAGEFTLVGTRGGAFDLESNDVTSQEIDDMSGVLGYVSNLSSTVAEPDTQANESVLDSAFAGVTLSNNVVAGGSIYAADATGYAAPTGNLVFAPGPNSDDGFREGDDELRADFVMSVREVSIDVGSDDGSDVGFLRAFDSAGNLLQELVSSALSSGQRETLTITRSEADIAYIIAAGVGTDITPIDNLYFEMDADEDVFQTTLRVGDQISLTGYLPGQGPHLFRNGLDIPGDSQLRIELSDPNGTVLGDSNASIIQVAAIAGDYTIRVYAASGAGEYFLQQAVNRAPIAVDDSVTTNEDTLANIDVLGNDNDPEGTSLSVTGLSSPSNGTAVLRSDGTIDYTPFDDFFGDDSFTYTVEDEDGLSSTASVNVSVSAVNDAPTDITLSSSTIAENTDTRAGAVEIGVLDATDIDSSIFTFSLVPGNGDGNNGDFEIVGDRLRIKQDVVIDYETTPQYSVRIEVSDGEVTFEKQMLIDVIDRVEVETVTIGDGTQQRSQLENLIVRFDGLVTVGSDAFQLKRRGVDGGSVAVVTDVDSSSGNTLVTLTFGGGFVENSGSLVDGNYQLTIDGSRIQSSTTGEFLDGDSDGIAGGDYVLGDQESDSLFRFFGDVDGDRVISSIDLLRFRQTFGKEFGDTGYDDRFDFDDDQVISSLDLLMFRQNFGDSLDFE